jgi:hypothetical protein
MTTSALYCVVHMPEILAMFSVLARRGADQIGIEGLE